jgi:hypothetical protein
VGPAAKRRASGFRLPVLALEQTQRITALQDRYQVKFELRMNSRTRQGWPGGCASQ